MHANCALTYAETETWCNYQQTTNYHQHCYIWPFPPWDAKLKALLFLIWVFFFMYSYFHTNDVFILEGFQSNQITMVLPLIRHNRAVAGGERRRKSWRTHFVIFCKSGLHWVITFCLDIMFPIISRGLWHAKIKQKEPNTALLLTHPSQLLEQPIFFYEVN